MAIDEWNSEDDKAIETCWRVAYALSSLEETTKEMIEWGKLHIKTKEMED